MSFVGVFRKVEMDEKPFLVYTLTQTDNPTSSSETLTMDKKGGHFPLVPSYFHVPHTVFFGKAVFPKECVECPSEIKHPSHPFHSLLLNTYPPPNYMWIGCNACGEIIKDMSYNCMVCKLHMHPVCAKRPVPLVVDHPKSHPHSLTLFPTQDSLVCHICSQIKKLDPTYICIQCVFVIHKGCIGFPHVIRICRHPHRISFTSSLPSKELSCGVCRLQVDNKYGAYSCKKCDNAYFVHSKCALHPMLWDGKELEGVPEEDDEIDDGEPFERIGDGVILHSFHDHNMRLEIFEAYDEKKYCQACTLPIYEGQFDSCLKCNFILHESCANAPREIRNPLYPHPLKLKDATKGSRYDQGSFKCSACYCEGNGFFYEHPKRWITEDNFKLDIRCASILEPFEYQGHKHPLYLPSNPEKRVPCKICGRENKFWLICLKCDYSICFCCATLPYNVRYKHDSHFLMLCDKYKASDQQNWCEICERKVEAYRDFYGQVENKERRFYKCNDCCTTLHVKCLLGIDFFMKPSETRVHNLVDLSPGFEILVNSSLTRPFCTRCGRRCPFPIFFKGGPLDKIFCTLFCCDSSRYKRI